MKKTLCGSPFIMDTLVLNKKAVSVKRRTPAASNERCFAPDSVVSPVITSPKQDICDCKPSGMELASHLAKVLLAFQDPARARTNIIRYLNQWTRCLEKSVRELEAGDRVGTQWYRYEFDGPDPVCSGYLLTESFVRRAEIRLFPEIVPPFHLGCTCRLKQHTYVPGNRARKKKSILHPLFISDELPLLPDWRELAPLSN